MDSGQWTAMVSVSSVFAVGHVVVCCGGVGGGVTGLNAV